MKNLKLILFVTCLVSSCVGKKPNDANSAALYNIKISCLELKQEVIENMYEEAYFLPLETNPDILLGEIEKNRIEKGNVYLTDGQKIVEYLLGGFNEQGRAGKLLNRMGRGPGEYRKIEDFAFTNKYLVVFEGRNVKLYDIESWDFVRSIRLKFCGIQMQAQNDHLIFFTLHLQNHDEYDYEIIVLNMNSGKVKKFFKHSKSRLGVPAMGNQLNRINNAVYYAPPLRNITYKFNAQCEPEVFATWNYKMDEILDLRESTKSYEELAKSDLCFFFNDPMVINQYLYVQFCHKGHYGSIWFNTKDKSHIILGASFLPQACFKNYIISPVPSWQVAQFDKTKYKNDQQTMRMYSKVLNVNESDNPCLLIKKVRYE
jgi:hypothetical protein